MMHWNFSSRSDIGNPFVSKPAEANKNDGVSLSWAKHGGIVDASGPQDLRHSSAPRFNVAKHVAGWCKPQYEDSQRK